MANKWPIRVVHCKGAIRGYVRCGLATYKGIRWTIFTDKITCEKCKKAMGVEP